MDATSTASQNAEVASQTRLPAVSGKTKNGATNETIPAKIPTVRTSIQNGT